jgi:unsaturated rhamnogalacturonyl hydrolase
MNTPVRLGRGLLTRLGLAAFASGLAASAAAAPASADLQSWPAGASPQEIGRRVAERFIASPHPNFAAGRKSIIYPEVCAWYGALTFAQLAGDRDLTAKLARRFDPLFGPEAYLIPQPIHVDLTVFAAVPLQLYIETKDPRYLQIGQPMADAQWDKPLDPAAIAQTSAAPVDPAIAIEAVKAGLTPQTRYWVDDMYMITIVQVQAYRATGDRKYVDRAAREVAAYLDKLQEPNGLFHHAPDVPYFWGRGDGWFAVGMAELLRSLPEDHPLRPRIMEGYRKMMASLLRFQDANGMWHQLIDHPEAWPETSCTGMFTFAMITGVKNGWLDAATYGPAARRGWLGLISYINPNGDVRQICEGTNKKADLQYYLNRGRKVGDMHGQAPVLWCASALLR